jgi:hypothetical protein
VAPALTTMVWNTPTKSWTGGSTMADASLNRRMAVRPADGVASAQVGVVGLDGQIELEALRRYGLPEAARALLCGTPTLPVGQREFAVETPLDLPNLAAGAVHLVDVTVPGARQGDRNEASLAWSTRFIDSTQPLGATTRCACWRAMSRAAPSTSARRRCRWRSRSGGSRERGIGLRRSPRPGLHQLVQPRRVAGRQPGVPRAPGAGEAGGQGAQRAPPEARVHRVQRRHQPRQLRRLARGEQAPRFGGN